MNRKIQTTRLLVSFKKRHLFQSFSKILYRTHSISSNNKRDVRSKVIPPFFFKVTDTTRIHGSQQLLQPSLSERRSMQHRLTVRTSFPRVYWGMFCHSCCRKWVSWFTSTGTGWFLASYSLSNHWQEPYLESERQEVWDDLVSVRSGIVVLQSGTWSHGLRAGWMRGHRASVMSSL